MSAVEKVEPTGRTRGDTCHIDVVDRCGNLVSATDGPINELDPATIRIGEPVRVVFTTVEDVVLPRWVRAGEG